MGKGGKDGLEVNEEKVGCGVKVEEKGEKEHDEVEEGEKINWEYRIGGEGGERMEREIGVNVKEEKEWRGR